MFIEDKEHLRGKCREEEGDTSLRSEGTSLRSERTSRRSEVSTSRCRAEAVVWARAAIAAPGLERIVGVVA